MTACVNKHTKRVAAVVTASLVGALSVGAPAVALAAPAGNGIETLTMTPAEAFSTAKIEINDSYGEPTFVADGKPQTITVDEVHILQAAVKVDVTGDDFEISFYKAGANGEPTGEALASVVDPGNYVVTVEAVSGHYKGGVAKRAFSVKPAELTGVDFFESGSEVKTDKTLIYSGSKIEVGFTSTGVELTEGVDYTVKVLKKGTEDPTNAKGVDIVEAGDYVAYLTGIGQYAGDTAEVAIHVGEFSFAHAVIVVDDVIASNAKPSHPTRVTSGTGDTFVELDPTLVSLSFDKGTDGDAKGSSLFDKTGAYDFIASVDPENKSFTNTDARKVTVNKVAKNATFKVMGGEPKDSYFVNLAKGENFYAAKDIKVLNGSKELVSGYDYSVSVIDAKGQDGWLPLQLQTPGTYTVTVKVNPESSNVKYQVGGTVSFKVTVVEDVLDADAKVAVKYNNNVVDSVVKTFDNDPIVAGDFEIQAVDNSGNILPSADFTRTLFDSEGKKVDSAIHAGKYTLKITSTKYSLTGTTEIPVTINKVNFADMKIASLSDWFGAPYLKLETAAYNWNQFDLRYNTGVADDDKTDAATDGKAYDLVPTSWAAKTAFERFDEEKGEWVEDAANLGKVEGKWRVTVKGTDADAVDYTFADAETNSTTVEYIVVAENDLVFRDVKPGEWFFGSIADAKHLGYVKGISGTKYYKPNTDITRADTVIIIARMAGMDGVLNGMDEGEFNKVYGTYMDQYSDVDEGAYYAKAVAWATKMGIAHGNAGQFRPNDSITREEFAALLSNYAKANGVNIAVDTDEVLAGANGAETVSPWMRDAVAWAYSEGIMGNNGASLDGTGNITRAQTAAMAVNYQPAPLK